MAGEAFGLGRPEVKAELARLGQQLQPGAQLSTYPRPASGQHAVVVLERVVANETPEYCTHGYASCINCEELCWLGDETVKVVTSQQAYPICVECATAVFPPGTQPSGHLRDHRRSDGPH